MELLLDTADLAAIREGIADYPISGVTTNPSIIRKAAPADFFSHMRSIRAMIGERSLHVQVVGTTRTSIVEDAEAIWSALGSETYVKIPVTREGLAAMGMIRAARRDARVTATAIYTEAQGEMAIMAGASHLAVYYNRMCECNVDADAVIRTLASLCPPTCGVLAASFHTAAQVTHAYSAGAAGVTVPPALLSGVLSLPSIERSVEDFTRDWNSLYGNVTISDLLRR